MRKRNRSMPITYAAPAEALNNLQLVPHLVLEKYRTGSRDEEDWHTLAVALNVGAVLSRKQAVEVQEVLSKALDALCSFGSRGNWILTGNELRAIGEGLTMTDEIYRAVTRREIRDALQVVLKEGAAQ
jgi:hypothetical protein